VNGERTKIDTSRRASIFVWIKLHMSENSSAPVPPNRKKSTEVEEARTALAALVRRSVQLRERVRAYPSHLSQRTPPAAPLAEGPK
jgi:hypothetical protein